MEIRIAKANNLQALDICTVLRRSIAEVCTKDHGGDPANIQAWLANKTEENVKKWLTTNYTLVAVQAPSAIIGVGMFSKDGEILLNYLLPEFIACGIGKQILLAMEVWARKLGLTKLTAVSTLTAYEFYKKNGFIECPSGAEDGIAMYKSLS